MTQLLGRYVHLRLYGDLGTAEASSLIEAHGDSMAKMDGLE